MISFVPTAIIPPPHIPEMALDGKFGGVTDSAHDLHGLGHHPEGGLGRKEFGHSCLPGHILPLIELPRGPSLDTGGI